MVRSYGFGVLCAILSGVVNALGAVLQKSAVNRIPVEQQSDGFMAQLLRSPSWLVGLGMILGLGTVFTLTAQSLIGPALLPGLSASGMIILAIAATRFIGEKLRSLEMLGIVGLVCGISLLGLSRLDIPSAEVSLHDRALLLRLALFTVGLGLCWLLSFLIAREAQRESRGLIMAISGAFPYCLSNLWVLPLLLTIGLVFGGTAQAVEVLLFVTACVILVATNAAAIRQVQEAYRFAPASKVQPIQQIPTQIVPVLIYFFVFQRSAPKRALLLVPVGVLLIIVSGFLLAGRRVQFKES